MHILSNKDLQFRLNWTLLEDCRNTTTVVTADGDVQTNEEASSVIVYEFPESRQIRATVHTTRGHACSSITWECSDQEHGVFYTNEWASGPKATSDQTREKDCVRDRKFRSCPGIITGLSSSSSLSSSCTASFPQDSSSTSPSPARLRSVDHS